MKKIIFIIMILTLFCLIFTSCGTVSSVNESLSGQSANYTMSETINVGGLEINIKYVEDSKKIGVGSSTATENNFVIITMEITNKSTSEETVIASDINYYVGDIKYDYSGASIWLENGIYVSEKLNPGLKKTIQIAFEIPNKHSVNDILTIKHKNETAKISLDKNASTKKYKIGEKVSIKNVDFTVLSIEDTQQIGEGSYSTLETTNNFVILTLKIRNNSTETITIESESIIYYVGNTSYTYNTSACIYLDDCFYLQESINGNMEKTIKVVYEIPQQHKQTDYLLVTIPYTSEKILMK